MISREGCRGVRSEEWMREINCNVRKVESVSHVCNDDVLVHQSTGMMDDLMILHSSSQAPLPPRASEKNTLV